MPAGRWQARHVAVLLALVGGLGACGGRVGLPPNATAPARAQQRSSAPATSGVPTVRSTTSVAPSGGDPPTGSVAQAVAGSSGTAAASRTTDTTTAMTAQRVMTADYEAYLADLSGLDDTLNKSYVGPLASVTTTRLAQATVRQAAAILAAHEHAVGALRDDKVAITMTGPTSAALVDCQDEQDFSVVSDGTGTPDPFVGRGDFVGSAQMVLQNGRWLVDTFTTTHLHCSY